jgi:hypothetical protein
MRIIEKIVAQLHGGRSYSHCQDTVGTVLIFVDGCLNMKGKTLKSINYAIELLLRVNEKSPIIDNLNNFRHIIIPIFKNIHVFN